MVYELEDRDEQAAFYELDSDRAVAVVGTAIVENRLTSLLKAAMKQDDIVFNDLFHPSGPLGSFGTKIRLAYLLCLIHEDVYKDLVIVAKIRNAFAHRVAIKSFDDQMIKDNIHNLRSYSVWKTLRESLRIEAHDTPQDSDFQLKAAIVRDELCTMRDSFRMCLRMYIWKLVIAEKAVKTWSAARPAPATDEDISHGQDVS